MTLQWPAEMGQTPHDGVPNSGSRGTPLRVLINDRVLLLQRTGVGHYVQQLLRAIGANASPSHRVRGFFASISGRLLDKSDPKSSSPPPPTAEPPRPPAPGRRSEWFRTCLQAGYGLAFRMRARGFDLVHEPNHIPPRTGRPTVTTIHDLSVLVHPEWHPADRVRWYERAFQRGMRQTIRFIAASEFTRSEMVRVLGLSPDRIEVTHQAARPGFRPQPAESIAALRRRFGLPGGFFLFVGTLEPRKNLLGLLDAYAGLSPGLRRRAPLAIAGGWGWNTEALTERLRRLDVTADVRLLGYVEDDVLAGLYSSCTALVWPSLYEGFGLPPLEALACGAPVIVSQVASLPEVVGSSAVLLAPQDAAAWTAAMQRMLEDEPWRAAWAARGPAHAATFSWAECARQTLAVYERAARAARAD